MTIKISLLIMVCSWALFVKIECEFIDCFEQSDGSTCQCDREDKMIDCRSIKSTFPVIQTKNDEYTAMSLAHTKLDTKTIPYEKNLLQKLPNLLVVDLSGIINIRCSELQQKFSEIEILSSCVDDLTTIGTTTVKEITTAKSKLIEKPSQSTRLTTTEQSEVYTTAMQQTPSIKAKNVEKCKTTWCEAKKFYRTLKEHVMDIIKKVRTEIRKKILSQEKQRQKQALLAKST